MAEANVKTKLFQIFKIDLIISLVISTIFTGIGFLPQLGRLSSNILFFFFPSYKFVYSLLGYPDPTSTTILKLTALNFLLGTIYVFIWAIIVSFIIYVVKNMKTKEENQKFLHFTWKKFFSTLTIGVFVFIYSLIVGFVRSGGGTSYLTMAIIFFGIWPFAIINKISQNFPIGYTVLLYVLAVMTIIFQFYLVPCIIEWVRRRIKREK